MRNKYVAAGLALCFGWLGFHKFYLGKWIQGILYIIFMFSAIPLILSVCEAILYAVNTQEWFDVHYNQEYLRYKASK